MGRKCTKIHLDVAVGYLCDYIYCTIYSFVKQKEANPGSQSSNFVKNGHDNILFLS